MNEWANKNVNFFFFFAHISYVCVWKVIYGEITAYIMIHLAIFKSQPTDWNNYKYNSLNKYTRFVTINQTYDGRHYWWRSLSKNQKGWCNLPPWKYPAKPWAAIHVNIHCATDLIFFPEQYSRKLLNTVDITILDFWLLPWFFPFFSVTANSPVCSLLFHWFHFKIFWQRSQ